MSGCQLILRFGHSVMAHTISYPGVCVCVCFDWFALVLARPADWGSRWRRTMIYLHVELNGQSNCYVYFQPCTRIYDKHQPMCLTYIQHTRTFDYCYMMHKFECVHDFGTDNDRWCGLI